MLIGVGFFALLTGAMAQRFRVEEVREIGQAEHELIVGEVDARGEVLQELPPLLVPRTSRLAGVNGRP
jgi:hypothetical protein